MVRRAEGHRKAEGATKLAEEKRKAEQADRHAEEQRKVAEAEVARLAEEKRKATNKATRLAEAQHEPDVGEAKNYRSRMAGGCPA